MDLGDVSRLLAVIQQHQPVDPTKETVAVWAASLYGEIPREFALQWLAVWYSEFRDPSGHVRPAHINKAWRDHVKLVTHSNYSKDKSKEDRALYERRCTRVGCTCSHTGPCYKGWIDSKDGDTTQPCQTCNPKLADRLSQMPPRGERNDSDFHAFRESARGIV